MGILVVSSQFAADRADLIELAIRYLEREHAAFVIDKIANADTDTVTYQIEGSGIPTGIREFQLLVEHVVQDVVIVTII